MWRLFVGGLAMLAVSVVHAQSTNSANASKPAASDLRNNPLISFLTPAEQNEYAIAHAKALGDDPALKAEGEKILQQGKSAATPADRQAFIQAMEAHRQKLRAAMLKEDPGLKPIFAEIDKHLSEAKAKQLGQVQGSPVPFTGTH